MGAEKRRAEILGCVTGGRTSPPAAAPPCWPAQQETGSWRPKVWSAGRGRRASERGSHPAPGPVVGRVFTEGLVSLFPLPALSTRLLLGRSQASDLEGPAVPKSRG